MKGVGFLGPSGGSKLCDILLIRKHFVVQQSMKHVTCLIAHPLYLMLDGHDFPDDDVLLILGEMIILPFHLYSRKKTASRS